MEQQTKQVKVYLDGFSPVSTTRIHWNSRKRSASLSTLNNVKDYITPETPNKQEKKTTTQTDETMQEPTPNSVLSEKRKALFEPLEPIDGRRPSNESLLPPPDFDCTSYPRGWLAGKKRKLVNVDVVDTMRRIAIQEMNRKDREIDGLNEQLEEDSRCLEHLQLQLLEERSKRAEVEREKTLLQEQVSMLMNMLDENEDPEES